MEFWTPLELVSEIYSEEYLDSYKDIHSGSSGLGTNMSLFLNNNGNNIGSLIDIGCGNGLFIDKLRSRGFTVKGIDLDEKSIAYCRKLSLDVYNQHLDSFISGNPEFIHTFDYITFFEVLEHQDNPLQFLYNVKSLLNPSGKIAFSVPDRNKVTTKMFKLYGLLFDPNNLLKVTKRDFPPHHFLWFNQKVLRYILSDIGFTEISFNFQVIIIASRYIL
jgi:SAM-dependent methyltransferase